MKITELLGELKQRECFNEFKSKYPESFFCTAFFILAKHEKEKDEFQLDFFIPEENKMASFKYPFNSYRIHEDKIESIPEINDLELKVDLDNLKERVKEEVKKEYEKIIAIFQKNLWNITCINGIDIKRIKINPYTGEIKEASDLKMIDIIRFEKKA